MVFDVTPAINPRPKPSPSLANLVERGIAPLGLPPHRSVPVTPQWLALSAMSSFLASTRGPVESEAVPDAKGNLRPLLHIAASDGRRHQSFAPNSDGSAGQATHLTPEPLEAATDNEAFTRKQSQDGAHLGCCKILRVLSSIGRKIGNARPKQHLNQGP